jgi:hypothetical protein
MRRWRDSSRSSTDWCGACHDPIRTNDDLAQAPAPELGGRAYGLPAVARRRGQRSLSRCWTSSCWSSGSAFSRRQWAMHSPATGSEGERP